MTLLLKELCEKKRLEENYTMKMQESRVKPLVSVIIPIYNNAPFLHRCIDSILTQTYDLLEILLVDDGSQDGSREICDEYKLMDKRVKVIHKSNEGTVSARKCGLDHAKGRLVSFVDGDDWIEKNMYENLVEFYLKEEYPDIISSGLIYEYLDSNTRKLVVDGANEKKYNEYDIKQELLPILIYDAKTNRRTVLTSTCTKLIDKVVAKKAMAYMNYSLSVGEDGAYLYFVVACCKSMLIIHQAFYHYELHRNSQNKKYDMGTFQKLALLKCVMTEGMKKLEWSIQVKEQIEYYVWRYFCEASNHNYHFDINRYKYLFPFAKCERQTVILVYGAGEVGKAYVNYLKQSKFASEIIWVDRDYERLQKNGLNVISIDEALQKEYDYIVIALNDERIACSVMEKILSRGVEKEKLVWETPIQIKPYGDYI